MDSGPNTQVITRRGIWVQLLLYPGHTLPTAAAPLAVAIGLAAHDRVLAFGPALLAFLASWLIHLAGVFADNHALITTHGDVPEHPELLEALRTGVLTTAALRLAIVACLTGAAVIAPWLAAIVGWPVVLALGAVGVAASLGYAAGPTPYARLGVADLVFFVMFALVAVPGAYYVQSAPHPLPAAAFVVGLPVGALVTNVLLIDDLRDRRWDRMKGWRTGAVRFGASWGRAELIALTALAYACPFWLWLGFGFTPWALLPLATAGEARAVARTVLRSERFEDLFPMTPRASRLALLYALLLGAGLAVRGG